MIFADGVKDVGSRRVWQSKRHALAPRDVDTSCVTQPPLVAIAAWSRRRIAAGRRPRRVPRRAGPEVGRVPLVAVPRARPEPVGLITLIHPWECGLDTTPPWMLALERMPMPWWLRVASTLRLARILRRLRYDTRHLPAVERPSDDDGLRMLALDRAREAVRLRPGAAAARGSVLIEDLAFNAMLIAANRALEQIAAETRPRPPGRAGRAVPAARSGRSRRCGTSRRGSTSRATR